MSIEAATPAKVAVNLENVTDLDQAWRVCSLLAQSDIVPAPLRGKAANVLLVYMTGRELGLTFAQSLRTIYIAPGGSPGLRGSLLLALLRRAGHDYWFDYAEDGNACTCHVKRGDTSRQYDATFSLDDALAAGLVKQAQNGEYVALSRDNKPLPWMQYRRIMLRWRSVAEAANIAAPEVMMGFDIIDYAGPQDGPVDLKPAAPSPGPADERPPTAAGTGEDPAAELAGLDARGAAASPGEGRPAEEATSTATPPPARPEGLIEGSGAQGESKNLGQPSSRTRSLQQVSEKFNEIGWTYGENKNEILTALTAHCRRVISKPGDLNAREATAVTLALAEIIRKNEPDHYLVAMSDAQSGWEMDWDRDDPEGYARDYSAALRN